MNWSVSQLTISFQKFTKRPWQRGLNKYVGPFYCRAEMYAGRVACCLPLVSDGEYADRTDRRTDARPLHYAFRYTRPASVTVQLTARAVKRHHVKFTSDADALKFGQISTDEFSYFMWCLSVSCFWNVFSIITVKHFALGDFNKRPVEWRQMIADVSWLECWNMCAERRRLYPFISSTEVYRRWQIKSGRHACTSAASNLDVNSGCHGNEMLTTMTILRLTCTRHGRSGRCWPLADRFFISRMTCACRRRW